MLYVAVVHLVSTMVSTIVSLCYNVFEYGVILSTIKQELANLFNNWSDGKYFRCCRPQVRLKLLVSATIT